MAWNTPGKGNPNDSSSGNGSGGNRNPWKPRKGGRGGGFDDFLDRFRGGFGGAGGPLRWIPAVIALWLIFSCFVLVTEQERGVVLRFGAFSRIMDPGPGFKLPWPIESVQKVNATEIKTFNTRVPVLTSDENIVEVEINVQYRIGNARRFLYGTRDSIKVLEEATLSSVREQVGRSRLDTVLGARDALAVASRVRLERSLESYRTGLVVTGLNLPNARPPEEVKPAFDDVNSAQQDKDRLISEALAYAAKVVPEARGEAARTRTVAEGHRTSAIARATGDAARFNLLLQQYRGAPDVTRKRLWLETLQEVLAKNRKVVGGDSRQLLYLPVSPARGAAAGAAPAQPTPELIAPAVTSTPEDDNTTRRARRERDGGGR